MLARAALVMIATLALGVGGWQVVAQGGDAATEASARRADYRAALEASRQAAERAEALEQQAATARQEVNRTASQRAALAARIQESEAGIAAAEARLSVLGEERQTVRKRLAERERPVIRLTGALQQVSRRPIALSVLKPGSLRETVYLRAVLSSTVPVVSQRTGALRAELERGRALEREASQAATVLRRREAQLEDRQGRLATLETRQRLASRAAGGAAAREADRALALAEEARDLDGLVSELERAGTTAQRLAALPGPRLRPARPAEARILSNDAPVAARPTGAPRDYRLPVTGQIVTGFGAEQGTLTSDGITFAPRGRAQAVAPAAGRIAFAGRYRGYGRIVIIDHGGGWTSLLTGLARVDVQVGERVGGGAPLGIAPPGDPRVTLELRRGGQPVNPLQLVG